ncbi:MAG: hypothetical protein ACIAQF_14080 [Phycisphaerales bacterium JB065]
MDVSDASHGPSRPIEHAEDYIARHASQHFEAMVESVGVKRFADGIGLSTRQINRILAGAQPNPVNRLVKCIQSCTPEAGDAVLDFLCKEAGGHFIRDESGLDSAALNAVKECAQAIAAISDGKICPVDEKEIREAIAALLALSRMIRKLRESGHQGELDIPTY